MSSCAVGRTPPTYPPRQGSAATSTAREGVRTPVILSCRRDLHMGGRLCETGDRSGTGDRPILHLSRIPGPVPGLLPWSTIKKLATRVFLVAASTPASLERQEANEEAPKQLLRAGETKISDLQHQMVVFAVCLPKLSAVDPS